MNIVVFFFARARLSALKRLFSEAIASCHHIGGGRILISNAIETSVRVVLLLSNNSREKAETRFWRVASDGRASFSALAVTEMRSREWATIWGRAIAWDHLERRLLEILHGA